MNLSVCLFLLALFTAHGQIEGPVSRIIAFYNVENLFDTLDDEKNYDEDYTQKGKNQYGLNDYKRKISRLASVIRKIGIREDPYRTDVIGADFIGPDFIGPDIIGVSEVENRQVLEDLVAQPELSPLSYSIIHEDSPDRRGIDVALLYREQVFFPLSYETIEVRLWDESGNRIYTRDILWVHGILDGEEIHLLVNHWPSRRGGASRSAPKRMKAARLNREIIESIKRQDPGSKILIMGDFNDDPVDESISKGLSGKSIRETRQEDFFNPMIRMYRKGWNTLVYRDQVHLFDQILLSHSLVQTLENNGFRLSRAGIYNPDFLRLQEGKYRGYPYRSFANGKYTGGYSDHFPVFVELLKP